VEVLDQVKLKQIHLGFPAQNVDKLKKIECPALLSKIQKAYYSYPMIKQSIT